jgi:hypothetical protein
MTRAATLALMLGLAGCGQQPRAASYFRAHIDEAAKVLVDCEAGFHRGAECANAEQGIGQSQSAARMAQYKKSF